MSINIEVAVGASCAITLPVSQQDAKRPELEFLSDSSPRDASSDEHKAWADRMADALAAGGLKREAARVRDCAEALFFQLVADEHGELHFRLRSAPYCHYRHCPICQWRRSLRSNSVVMSALPRILEKHPTARFAMLTLTVRNCAVYDLRRTILAMNRGRKRLIERKGWPALGWICAVEVTRAKDDSAHPHFHLLLMLPASYFGKGYVPTKEWSRRWREAMRLDYDPVVDIRVVKPKAGVKEAAEGTEGQGRLLAVRAAVAEVVKYAVKAKDLLSGGPEWLREYVDQVRSLKFLTSGGALKGILKAADEDEKEDLVHVNGKDDSEEFKPFDNVIFHWRKKHKRYARKWNV
ncbi:MAG: protein rep [Desulfomonilaceae bacterium]